MYYVRTYICIYVFMYHYVCMYVYMYFVCMCVRARARAQYRYVQCAVHAVTTSIQSFKQTELHYTYCLYQHSYMRAVVYRRCTSGFHKHAGNKAGREVKLTTQSI